MYSGLSLLLQKRGVQKTVAVLQTEYARPESV